MIQMHGLIQTSGIKFTTQMPVFSLSYHSRSLIGQLTPVTKSGIVNILEVSRARNAAAGVTGALMFNDGHFAQILEGNEDAVMAIFASIQRDIRHTTIQVLAMQPQPARTFDKWSMAFVGLASLQAREYYEDFKGAGNFEWEKLTGDRLGRFMLTLMQIDAKPSTV